MADNSLRRGVTSLYHNSPTVGHPGILKTCFLLTKDYWWPHMKDFVSSFVRGCVLRLFSPCSLIDSSRAHYGLSSPTSYFGFVNHVTFPSTITLLFVITCRRGSPSSLSRTLTHHAYLLIFLSPISCTILRPVVAGRSQAPIVFNLS